jgi:predicted acyltransferase
MTTPLPITTNERFVSVDALRGFDMFWIVGGAGVVHALDKMVGNETTTLLSTQFKHVEWEGFRFYDLIFPLFLFIVGVSMAFSLDRSLAERGRAATLARVLKRSLLLYALGVFYYGGLSKAWPDVQLAGVLQRIAACYLGAALVYAFVRSAGGLLTVAAALLFGYWALLAYVPFPDLKLDKATVEAIAQQIGSSSPSDIAASISQTIHGTYDEGRNLTNYIDFLYLPGKKANLYYINEGLLSTLPAIALPLFGALAGLLLKNPLIVPARKIAWLVVSGVAAIGLATLWSYEFPWIKRIWTSSFVLLTAGCSALLLAVFYWLVDVRRWRTWCQPFVWIGSNAITIYVVAQIVGFSALAARLVGGEVSRFLDAVVVRGFGNFGVSLVALFLALALTRFLYQRKIFLRV